MAHTRREAKQPRSVVVLPLTVDDVIRSKLEKRFSAAFAVRRATTRTFLTRLDALRADPAWRAALASPAGEDRTAELGRLRTLHQFTSFDALKAARAHTTASGWMGGHGHLSQGVAGVIGEQVWAAFAGHVFGVETASGTRKFRGRPRIPRYFETTVLPGVARASTGKWESNRLVRDPATGHSSVVLGGTRQAPTTLTIGVKARVRSGPDSARGQRTAHWLEQPDTWAKVDIVREKIKGAWVYTAHLHLNSAVWRGDRYACIPVGRVAGFDLGVGSIGVVSRLDQPTGAGSYDVAAELVARDAHDVAVDKAARVLERRRGKGADRSRRASNPTRYKPGKRQQATPGTPTGARVAAHRRTYRSDTLTTDYRALKAALAEAKRVAAAERRRRTNELAKALVLAHGSGWVAEDVAPYVWQRLWGSSVGRFAPGLVQQAITREAGIAGGQVRLVSTFTTALSQTCPCGTRVPKTLSVRTHTCPRCGLTGQRDVTSALAATCTTGAAREARLDPAVGLAVVTSLPRTRADALPLNRRQDAELPAPAATVHLQHRSVPVGDLGPAGNTETPDTSTPTATLTRTRRDAAHRAHQRARRGPPPVAPAVAA